MKRNVAIFVLAAGIHFTTGLAMVYFTPSVVASESGIAGTPALRFRMLTWATRVIHYPVISRSLYSRSWFPGNWVLVPMAANSLLWAAPITFGVWLVRRKRGG
jgi:hypothetical protein